MKKMNIYVYCYKTGDKYSVIAAVSAKDEKDAMIILKDYFSYVSEDNIRKLDFSSNGVNKNIIILSDY